MIKQLSIHLFFLFFICNILAQEKIYYDKDWNETTAENAEFYRIAKKDGDLYAIKDYYKNGTLQFEGFAQNTKDPLHNEGTCIWYHENGKIAQKVEFKDNKKNGPFILNYENGNAKVRAYYINDLEHGELTEHFPSGKVGNIANFKNGEIEGVHTKYRYNGDLVFKIAHKNSLEDGPYEFYSYRKLEFKGNAKNGFQEGKCFEYHPESDVISCEYTVKDKKLDGAYITYDETGKKAMEGIFKEGIAQSYKADVVVRGDEKYLIEMQLKNGVEVWKVYVNDMLTLESFYKNGIRVKTWKLYTQEKGELYLTIDYTKANCDDGHIQQVDNNKFSKSFTLSDRFMSPFSFPVEPCENVKTTEIIPNNIGSSIISYYESVSEEMLQNAEDEKVRESKGYVEEEEVRESKGYVEEEEVEEIVIESTENWREERVCNRYKDYLTTMACIQLKNDIKYTLFVGADPNSLKIINAQDKPVENELFIFYQDDDVPFETKNRYVTFSISKKLKKAYKKGNLSTTDIIKFIKNDFVYYSETSAEELTKKLEEALNN